eukprot:CAMPEP_0119421344 /NCGR_PEP_ID=MMETSP1335-20130426/25700_1 /TAXON_ID=259385 /ORGANISM="Chrysoculter rhomboideus, Strain RCC1486" /LENGTH=284 /DNA_ID=CAMNT_0007446751 /DNA_START=56 /DNA_END=907 /DNA_ORIENTATION=+
MPRRCGLPKSWRRRPPQGPSACAWQVGNGTLRCDIVCPWAVAQDGVGARRQVHSRARLLSAGSASARALDLLALLPLGELVALDEDLDGRPDRSLAQALLAQLVDQHPHAHRVAHADAVLDELLARLDLGIHVALKLHAAGLGGLDGGDGEEAERLLHVLLGRVLRELHLRKRLRDAHNRLELADGDWDAAGASLLLERAHAIAELDVVALQHRRRRLGEPREAARAAVVDVPLHRLDRDLLRRRAHPRRTRARVDGDDVARDRRVELLIAQVAQDEDEVEARE